MRLMSFTRVISLRQNDGHKVDSTVRTNPGEAGRFPRRYRVFLERKTGFGPATFSFATQYSITSMTEYDHSAAPAECNDTEQGYVPNRY